MRLIIWLFVAVILMAMLGIGQTIHDADPNYPIEGVSSNFTIMMYNVSDSVREQFMNQTIVVEKFDELSAENIYNQNEIYGVDFGKHTHQRIGNIIMIFGATFTEFFLKVSSEIIAWGIEFGFYHPEWDYLFIAKIFICCMIIYAILSTWMFWAVLGYLIYLLFKWIFKKRDKKEAKK